MDKEKKETSTIPRCIGFILDGNRRWAKERGLPTLKGHQAGYEKVKEMLHWAKDAGVGTVVVYAFSSENWKRSEEEVGYLMGLLLRSLAELGDELKDQKFRVSVIGERESLPKNLQEEITRIEDETKDFTGLHLVVAISYGGRAEIVEAVNKIIDEKVGKISEKDFANYLWTKDIPDPDLIIRTGGDRRLSNFLTWQSVYSELLFLDMYWPDFSKEDFDAVLTEFAHRERRLGK